MKKTLFIIATMLCSCINVFSQATSLTIDCQTPGWLSSKINYSDQETLQNIKITGYINGTDIKFIRGLNNYRNLNGCIDLKDVNIVTGGDSYITVDNNPKTTYDNYITGYMFAYLDTINKLVLPESITQFYGTGHFYKTRIDTLIINGNIDKVSIGDGYNNKEYLIPYIKFPEGVKDIDFGLAFHNPYGETMKVEMFLPSTIEKVTAVYTCTNENHVFHCSSTNPENILDTDNRRQYGHNNYIFRKGTIYVPKGTKEKYEQSIFRNLTIIEDIPVEGISLTDSISLYVGDTFRIKANVYPSDALNQNIIWESSNPEIVEIDETGLIHAIAFGTAIITVTTEDGGYKSSCKIYVYDHCTGIDMADKITIPIDKSYTLNAHTLPLSTSDDIITYKNNNDEIALVDTHGIVTAKKKGNCIITATTVDGGYTATCEVTVTQPVEALTLEKHSISLKVGETDKLFAQISPATADNKTIEWASSNETVAIVDASGNVTAIKAGESWVEAVSNDNAEAKDSCKVTVIQPVTGIQLDNNTYQLNGIGESFELKATVVPDDASNKDIKWMSSDESVCIVSQGLVVAVGYGTCVIIATTEDGGHMATCTVTVNNMTGISTVGLERGKKIQVYNANGSKRTRLQKGVNIIRFIDGTKKKIVIR